MAKEIRAKVRLLLPAGAASPAPPVSPALGPHGIALMDFCKQFNAKTADRKGQTIPVVVTVYTDRKFDFEIKTPQTSELIKKRVGAAKGSARPNKDTAGKISMKDIEEIAKIKLPDLNTEDLEQAKRVVAGSARSMGIEVLN